MSIKFLKKVQDEPLFSAVSPRESARSIGWLESNVSRGKSQPFAVPMEITPTLAEILLERNESNRTPRDHVIKRYSRQMKAGIWGLTGETIIISKGGILLNGQHRLKACVDAATSFPTFIVFGIDGAQFSHLDEGSKRSSADVFGIYSVPNASAMAAAAALLWKHQNAGMGNPEASKMPTNEELYEFYLLHTDLQKSHRAGHRFTEYKLASPAMCTMLHYLCAKKNRAEADAFFEKVATGVGLSAKEPAKKLRDKLIQNKAGSERLLAVHVGAFFVQAWNAQRQNKPINLFRFRSDQNPNEPFPGIV